MCRDTLRTGTRNFCTHGKLCESLHFNTTESGNSWPTRVLSHFTMIDPVGESHTLRKFPYHIVNVDNSVFSPKTFSFYYCLIVWFIRTCEK